MIDELFRVAETDEYWTLHHPEHRVTVTVRVPARAAERLGTVDAMQHEVAAYMESLDRRGMQLANGSFLDLWGN